MKQFLKKVRIWMIALVAMFAFGTSAFAEAEPDVTIHFADWDSSYKGWTGSISAVLWKSNSTGVSAWGDAWMGDNAYCVYSSNTKIHVTSATEDMAKIVLYGTDASVVKTWTGSSKSVDLGEGMNQAVYSIEVYFAAPKADYLTGQSVSEGEISDQTSLVYLYFEGHEMVSVDYTKITVGGKAIGSWQLGFWPNSNNMQFYVTFSNAIPLTAGDYTVVIPEGAITYADGKINEEIELEYYIPYPTADYLTGQSVAEGVLTNTDTSVTLYFNGHEIKSVDATQITVGGNQAIAVNFSSGDNFSVKFTNANTLASGNYSILIPKGAILFKDDHVNEEIELFYYLPVYVNVFESASPSAAGPVEVSDFTDGVVTINTDRPFEVRNAKATVNGAEVQATFDGSENTISVPLSNAQVGKTYTVVVPAGAILVADNTVNEEISLTYTIAPSIVEYLTGQSITEGEIEPTDVQLYLYFNDHAISAIDTDQITVADQNIDPSQLVFTKDADYFAVKLTTAETLTPGDYTVVIPEGAITYADGNLNEEIELEYICVIRVDYTDKSIKEGNLYPISDKEVKFSFDGYEIQAVDFSHATVGGQPATVHYTAGNSYFTVVLTEEAEIAIGNYTVFIPEGAVTFADGSINKAINATYAATQESMTLYYENAAAKAKLEAQLEKIQAKVEAVIFNDAVFYEDDYNTLVSEKAELLALIATTQAEIDAAFDEMKVTAYSLPEELMDDLLELQSAKFDCENVYAANLAGKTALLTHAQSVRTAIKSTLADAKCDDAVEGCDATAVSALNALAAEVAAVEDKVETAFQAKKTAVEAEVEVALLSEQPNGDAQKSQYSTLDGELTDIETALVGVKKTIADNNDRVRTSQRAADNILDKMLDVNFWTAAAKVEGYENFMTKGEHSHSDILYFDEIKALADQLKQDINHDNSHAGGHKAFDNYNNYANRLLAIKDKLEILKAAIEANEAANKQVAALYNDFKQKVVNASNFWNTYFTNHTGVQNSTLQAQKTVWNTDDTNADSQLYAIKNSLDGYYHDGAAEDVLEWVEEYLANNESALNEARNEVAYVEARNHYQQVRTAAEEAYAQLREKYSLSDPFVSDIMQKFVEEFAGEYGFLASLDTYKADIESAYAEGVMEDALNFDNHTHLGLHQQLEGAEAVLAQLLAEYGQLCADAHHLSNGKDIYSDQEYFTIGFFRQANDGTGAQGKEMFQHIYVTPGQTVIKDALYNELAQSDWVKYMDEVRAETYLSQFLVTPKVEVLKSGDKTNELAFTIYYDKNAESTDPDAKEDWVGDRINEKGLTIRSLAAGPADIVFPANSLLLEQWMQNTHEVTVGVNVVAPKEEATDAAGYALLNKAVFMVEAPIDLTYTINSLVATTDNGDEISFADAKFNTESRTVEFDLPEGTNYVEFPEGFLTFRGENNTILRSNALTLFVGNTTSIDGLIALGQKVQIFDLQGRRVKAESLIAGQTYIINGTKQIVK